MKILAVDSTAKSASAAVTEDEKTLASLTDNAGQTHSEVLLPMVMKVCKEAGVRPSEAELYAVTVGPGSFTGVRIGVACIKGLAFGRAIPCVGVSATEAFAEALAPHEGLYCPMIDARRKDVYNALFRFEGDTLQRLTEDRALSAKELAQELREKYSGETVYLMGDGAYLADEAFDGIAYIPPEEAMLHIDASAVARCALRAYRRGEYTTDAALSPVYLRLPQAERERRERLISK